MVSSNIKHYLGGAPDNSAQDSGAAYVFVRNGTVWTQQAFLKAGNTGPGDFFGAAVSISGELAAVGAPRVQSRGEAFPGDNSVSETGAAYLFSRTAGIWSQQKYLKAGTPSESDLYRFSKYRSRGCTRSGSQPNSIHTILQCR